MERRQGNDKISTIVRLLWNEIFIFHLVHESYARRSHNQQFMVPDPKFKAR